MTCADVQKPRVAHCDLEEEKVRAWLRATTTDDVEGFGWFS